MKIQSLSKKRPRMIIGFKSGQKESGIWGDYLKWSGVIGLLMFLLLGGVLIERIKGEKQMRRMNYQWLVPPRGLIMDRKGRLLVENRPFYFLGGKWLSYQDVMLELKRQGLSTVEVKEKLARLPVKYIRYYPFDPDTSGVIGYVSTVAKEELLRFGCENKSNKMKNYCLTKNEYVGRSGVEALKEVELQGVPGLVRDGVVVRLPEAGRNVDLNIDLDLQKRVSGVMRKANKSGGMIILDKEGKVLALSSMPDYEANIFSDGRLLPLSEKKKLLEYYLQSSQKPLINRVYQGNWPPGSVFKLVVATAGLEEGVIDGESLIEDTGYIKLGKYMFRNWYWTKYKKTDGKLNVVKAIARSNDIFFYRLGEKLGVDKIVKYAFKFGLGQKTSDDFINEEVGVVPSPEWKENNKGEKWFLGNTYHLAIGQGDLLTTIVQVARMTLIIANEGEDYKLSLIKGKKLKKKKLGFKGENMKIIKEGMKRACQKGGTAFVFFNFPMAIGCKTGTAENNKGEPHAWFTTFFPFDKPEYVITVMIENGGEGSYVAAPLAKAVIEYMMETGWIN